MDNLPRTSAPIIVPMQRQPQRDEATNSPKVSGARRPIQTRLPKAKAIKNEVAGLNIRSVASLIDGLVAAVVLFPLVLLSRHWWGLDQWVNPTSFQGAEDMYALANRTLYILLFLGWGIAGATLTALYPPVSMGYRWLGMNVVDSATHHPPTLTQWLIRAAMTGVDAFLLMGMGSFFMLLNAKRQGLRDLVARTIVVRDPRTAVFP